MQKPFVFLIAREIISVKRIRSVIFTGNYVVMKNYSSAARHWIAKISDQSWKLELEKASDKYHIMACWVAIIFDPVFAFTDYINIPENWKLSFVIRVCVSLIILLTLLFRKRLQLTMHTVVYVPFILISLQNAFTYTLIGQEDLLGHNLNYMALFIGAAMFVLWHWTYSAMMIILSALATIIFVSMNPELKTDSFFLNGGLLLGVCIIFMAILIQTRYGLTVREIKARLALQISNEEIQKQAEEIKTINESLEEQVRKRTAELEKKNIALEEYAFINAHKLRSPLASILGLVNLMKKSESPDDLKHLTIMLEDSANKLDDIVGSITKAIESGDLELEDLTERVKTKI